MPRTPRPRETGRPPAIEDPDKRARMLEAVAVGVPITQAVIRAGISESAHKRAMIAGEDAQDRQDARDAATEAGQDPDEVSPPLTERDEVYRAYRAEVTRARAEVAAFYVSSVAKAAKGGQLTKESTRRFRDGSVETERTYSTPDAKAAQFMLTTSFRGEFGKPEGPQRVELTGADGGPVETRSAEGDAVASLAARLAEVAQLQAGQTPEGYDEPRQIAPAERVDADSEPVDAEIVEDGR